MGFAHLRSVVAEAEKRFHSGIFAGNGLLPGKRFCNRQHKVKTT